MSPFRRTVRSLSIVLTPMMILGTIMLGYAPSQVGASSHREAPLISMDPTADNTDTYAFISKDAPNSVTIVANYIPFEAPNGAPNFFQFGDDVLYELHVDNVGDAKSHITYQFHFQTTPTADAGNTFLYNDGAITSLNDPNWKVPQTYFIDEIKQYGNAPATTTRIPATGTYRVPPVRVGRASTPDPDYANLVNAAIYTNGSGPNALKVFAGPRDDPFWVDLGSIFDLLHLRGQAEPVGYKAVGANNIPQDGVAGYNTHSIILQVPITRLMEPGATPETVIGVWATASRCSVRTAYGSPADCGTATNQFTQVSRLGMPLVNEVVIPRALKDAFNTLKPEQDAGLYTGGTPAGNLLKKSVLDPELGRLLKGLYGVPNPKADAPTKDRLDLQTIFLTGITTARPFTIHTSGGDVTVPAGTVVNQPKNVQPAEMIRLNTAVPFRPGLPGSLCPTTPDYKLGLLGGDVCGFPNGRRLEDDSTEIELLAVAGAAYNVVTPPSGGTFNFNANLIGVLSDNIYSNDLPFLPAFPYVAMPWSGTDFGHAAIYQNIIPQLYNGTSSGHLRYGGERDQ